MKHVVRGPGLRAEVHAGRGARISSLRSDDGFEWLLASRPTVSAGPGQPFVREGMGGWDEVAPTVQADAGLLDEQGKPVPALPDHGDIWNVPWTVGRAAPDELEMSVDLGSLPIRLERRISATGTGLRLDYRASTESPLPVPLLWCAHPQFAAGPDTTVALELSGKPVTPLLVEMYPGQGAVRSFPVEPVHGTLGPGTSLKVLAAARTTVDAAVLCHGGGRSLRIGWDPAALPYLGLFWDNGEFAREPVLAVEPSTSWGDRLSAAVRQGMALTVAAGAPLEWALDVSSTTVLK
ncbi:hypothetical protein [Arthrobacter stackebrandtii]|uniref:hypothetical protein n=1 Tax=Arthrobacter stackebrandtii TaxID=272161 RepID=UPI000D80C742|nr:hypothetical protein [Arthrobacter stackebrandtii]PYH01309.1 hypothetical protein CVV67_07055 [Arthrobacter stackebrandtii]